MAGSLYSPQDTPLPKRSQLSTHASSQRTFKKVCLDIHEQKTHGLEIIAPSLFLSLGYSRNSENRINNVRIGDSCDEEGKVGMRLVAQGRVWEVTVGKRIMKRKLM